MSIRITGSTVGQANPNHVEQGGTYRRFGNPDYDPAKVSWKDDGPSPRDQRPSAMAARRAAYNEARDAKKSVNAAMTIARISPKTARRIEQERKAAALEQAGETP